MTGKKDIEYREDVQRLVDNFYRAVRADEVIGYIFNDIAQVNWEAHLPVMYDFWETILLGRQSYTGNAMEPHIRLDQEKVRLEERHFERWLRLFTEAVDENFEGARAEEAKSRAGNIASMMQVKIRSLR